MSTAPPLPLDEDGYLLPGHPYDENCARQLAALEGLEPTPGRLEMARLLRAFVQEVGREPTQRAFASWLKARLPAGQVGSLQLRRLFPGGLLRQCSRIAGLPLPGDCLTAAEKLRRARSPSQPRANA